MKTVAGIEGKVPVYLLHMELGNPAFKVAVICTKF
jgi:hypothetical protein